jgi:hypothetical protein
MREMRRKYALLSENFDTMLFLRDHGRDGRLKRISENSLKGRKSSLGMGSSGGLL